MGQLNVPVELRVAPVGRDTETKIGASPSTSVAPTTKLSVLPSVTVWSVTPASTGGEFTRTVVVAVPISPLESVAVSLKEYVPVAGAVKDAVAVFWFAMVPTEAPVS